MATLDVKDAAGATVAIEKPLAPSRAAATVSKPVVLCNEDFAILDGLEAALATLDGRVDGIEALLTTLNGYVDGLEALLASSTVTGAGTVTGAQRTTLGSNDPAVIAVQALAALITSGKIPVDIASITGGNANGQAPPGNSAPVVVAGYPYETVAASQTAQVLGGSGATGDMIASLQITPLTTSPGLVTLIDNATSIPLFVGGASSVSNLIPWTLGLGWISQSGAWKITTGANVSVVASGKFT